MAAPVVEDFLWEQDGYWYLAPPPVPSEQDLEDVFGWIAEWYPVYAMAAWADPNVSLGHLPEPYAESLQNVPAGLIGSEAWGICVSWLKTALTASERVSGGFGLLGSPGTGKTTLMAAACYDYTRGSGQRACEFYDARKIVAWLKAQDQPAYERSGRMNKLSEKKVVFIDDLGVESSHDWDKSLITELFETRYAKGLPTCFTTNLKPHELADRYSERTIDRISQTTDLIPMVGASHRIRNTQ